MEKILSYTNDEYICTVNNLLLEKLQKLYNDRNIDFKVTTNPTQWKAFVGYNKDKKEFYNFNRDVYTLQDVIYIDIKLLIDVIKAYKGIYASLYFKDNKFIIEDDKNRMRSIINANNYISSYYSSKDKKEIFNGDKSIKLTKVEKYIEKLCKERIKANDCNEFSKICHYNDTYSITNGYYAILSRKDNYFKSMSKYITEDTKGAIPKLFDRLEADKIIEIDKKVLKKYLNYIKLLSRKDKQQLCNCLRFEVDNCFITLKPENVEIMYNIMKQDKIEFYFNWRIIFNKINDLQCLFVTVNSKKDDIVKHYNDFI